MATKDVFALTISPKYVPDWGKWEAFRELMQNVIDRHNVYDAAEIIFTYNPIQQRITIGNKLSCLERSTLVLGETSKTNDGVSIGKYGEGYKLALLVLLRLGVRVRIRTANEIWAPEIKFSEQFQTDLLTIKVIDARMSDALLFELDGITPEDYRNFQQKCLFINPPVNKIVTPIGNILLDEQLRGQVFVEGLHVCTFIKDDKVRYGYDMKANHIDLDRDRKKVSAYNLLWEVGIMFAGLDATYATMIFNLQKEEWRDCYHYDTHCRGKGNPLYDAICSMHHDDFIAKFGKNAIPVRTQEEADFVKEKYNDLNPVVTSTVEYRYVTESAAYSTGTKTAVVRESTPYTITKDAINKILSGKERKEARDLMIKEFLPMTREWKKR